MRPQPPLDEPDTALGVFKLKSKIMKKEDFIKGKKYISPNGDIFTFEKFDKDNSENEYACFLNEMQGCYLENEEGLIDFNVEHVLEYFKLV